MNYLHFHPKCWRSTPVPHIGLASLAVMAHILAAKILLSPTNKYSHAESLPLDQITVLTGLSKHSTPMEIRRCPLCNWPEEKEGEVQKNVLLEPYCKRNPLFLASCIALV